MYQLNLQHALKINAAFESSSEGGDGGGEGAAIIIFKIRERRRIFYLSPAWEGIEIRRSVFCEIVAGRRPQLAGRASEKRMGEQSRMYHTVSEPRG